MEYEEAMMHHIRPWQILRSLSPQSRDIRLTIPAHSGTESLTIRAIETILLVAAARIVRARDILEIGTSMGYTALHLAMNLPNTTHIFTVDKEQKPHAFDGTEWRPRIHFINKDIERIILEFIPWQDMVFCDCNYSPELIARCTEVAQSCRPKVIAWHDYGNPEAPWQEGVLDKLSESMELYHVEETWLVFWFEGGLA